MTHSIPIADIEAAARNAFEATITAAQQASELPGDTGVATHRILYAAHKLVASVSPNHPNPRYALRDNWSTVLEDIHAAAGLLHVSEKLIGHPDQRFKAAMQRYNAIMGTGPTGEGPTSYKAIQSQVYAAFSEPQGVKIMNLVIDAAVQACGMIDRYPLAQAELFASVQSFPVIVPELIAFLKLFTED